CRPDHRCREARRCLRPRSQPFPRRTRSPESLGVHLAGMDDAFAASVRQLRRETPGRLPRSLSVRSEKFYRRFPDAGFSGTSTSVMTGHKSILQISPKPMATTIPPPEIDQNDPPKDHNPGGGGVSTLGPSGVGLKLGDFSPQPTRTGIWIGLAAISMSFAAFTSALIVRQATSNDWRPLAL